MSYVKVGVDLLRSEGYVCPVSGEVVGLTASEKILYSYMRDRIWFFVTKQGGEYFDTQASIGVALNLNISTVRKGLTKLQDSGILLAEKRKFRNYWNWRYLAIRDLLLVVDGVPVTAPVKQEDECSPDDALAPPEWATERIDTC